MIKVKETDIDLALKELAFLKDGQNDDLGKLLTRTMDLLRSLRMERQRWKRLRKVMANFKRIIRSDIKLIDKLEAEC